MTTWMRAARLRLASLALAGITRLKSWGRVKAGMAIAATLALIASLAFTAFLFAQTPAAHAATGGCPGSNAIGNFQDSNDGLQAAYTTSGGTATYTFTSNNENSSGGIPGLIEYCVYTEQLPDSSSASYPNWQDPGGLFHFAFVRPDGDPSNVPFDGTQQQIGTATWNSGTAPTQIILLHINDPDECAALYNNGSSTCFVYPGGAPPALQAPTVSKVANGAYTLTYSWTDGKTASPTSVDPGGPVKYTVTESHDKGTISNIQVSGAITVNNPNSVEVPISSLTDQLSDATNCTVTNTDASSVLFPYNLQPGDNTFDYTCSSLSTSLPASNKATVSWDTYTDPGSGSQLAAGSNDTGDVSITYAAPTLVNNCITVTDTNPAGPQGVTICVGDAANAVTNDPGDVNGTFTWTYTVVLQPPTGGCKTVSNTVTSTTDPTGVTANVTDCNSGALTMGFWQNKNGQAIISGANQGNLGTWLRTYHPFSDAPSTGLASYVSKIIGAATCTSTSKTCNAMLRAQVLSTALDVYFSDPTLGGNKIGAIHPIGGLKIDLTTPENDSFAFGGNACMLISAMLTYQNGSQADPLADMGANWYGQTKATQVLAKDAFDNINNQRVVGC